MRRLFFLSLLFQFLVISLVAKNFYNDLKFDCISIEEGLSQSVVTYVFKDSQGFMWFGTQDGLNRFDGYEFVIYKYNKRNKYSITNNNISYINEDKNGYLWIGTSGGGVNKFNRITEEFERLTFISPIDTAIINTNFITSIVFDNNSVWIGTDGNGLLLYDIIQKKVLTHLTTSNSFLSHDIVNYFEVDSNNVWVSTHKGISRVDKNNYNIKLFLQEKDEFGDDIEVLSTKTEKSTIWIATWGNGLIEFSKKDFSYKIYTPVNDKNSIYSFYLNKIIIDDLGNKWIASWDGLCMLDTKGTFYNWKYDPVNPNSLSNDNVNHLIIDEKNMIWIGTWGGGINTFLNETPIFTHIRKIPNEKNSLSHNSVWSFYKDHNQILWVGTEGGLTKYDEKANTYKTYTYDYYNKNSLGDNTVYSIFEDSRNILWVGTWTGGLNRYDPIKDQFIRYLPKKKRNSISSNVINNIIEDINGDLWISSANGLNKFVVDANKFEQLSDKIEYADILINEIVLLTYQSKDGKIWIGTDGNGLFEYNPVTNEIKQYINDKNNIYSIGNNVIFSIKEDELGNIWCGTEAGLNILNIKTKKFKVISKDDGLTNDVVYGILRDGNDFWISTNNGISKISYDLEDDSISDIKNFDVSDNLQSTEFNLGAYYKDRSGYFYFGGINGFNKFHPDSISLDSTTPRVFFTDFQLFNESVEVTRNLETNHKFYLDSSITVKKKLVLSYHEKIISIEFAALDFKNPQKIKYKYRLNEFDDKWNITDAKRRFVTYTNLPPGNYAFEVKSINHHSFESKNISRLELQILPPFWLTSWFYVLLMILIVGSIYIYIRYRERTLRKEKILLEKQVKLRTREILEQKQEITDSIVYAKRIQNAVLTNKEQLNKITKENFLFYLPKSIVSGDFYWFSEINKIKLYVIADCTGHGVPGAFMSMLGISFLNKIVNENKITDPAEILNKLRKNIINSLHQTDTHELNDGMELSIITVNENTNTLYYAGAMNPAYVIQDTELLELKPDTMPISLHFKLDHPFKNQILKISSNAAIYMFTDGLIDQFGGKNNKRFTSRKLKNILLKINGLPFNEQKKIIEDEYLKWKGSMEQIDDVLMLGFRY